MCISVAGDRWYSAPIQTGRGVTDVLLQRTKRDRTELKTSKDVRTFTQGLRLRPALWAKHIRQCSWGDVCRTA